MNAFAKWIKKTGLRPADLARALGLPPSAIWKYSRDKYWPKRDVALRIRRFTGGEVSMDDLLDDDLPVETTAEHRSAQRAITEARQRKVKADAERTKRQHRQAGAEGDRGRRDEFNERPE